MGPRKAFWAVKVVALFPPRQHYLMYCLEPFCNKPHEFLLDLKDKNSIAFSQVLFFLMNNVYLLTDYIFLFCFDLQEAQDQNCVPKLVNFWTWRYAFCYTKLPSFFVLPFCLYFSFSWFKKLPISSLSFFIIVSY